MKLALQDEAAVKRKVQQLQLKVAMAKVPPLLALLVQTYKY